MTQGPRACAEEIMKYEPRPIPTDAIRLAAEILALIERLAENNHDVWACGRRNQGWRYGPEQNDALKTHPSLVPYAALSEADKDIDRTTVIETLKAITVLGCRILGARLDDVEPVRGTSRPRGSRPQAAAPARKVRPGRSRRATGP